jgi:hypothetical protein
MMAQMKEFCPELKVGARQTHRNMTLYCLLSAIDGELAGIEILNKFLPFREIHSKMVNSYVIDAIEKRKSVSLGNDLRLESERFAGAGLEFDDQIIQFSVFRAGNANGSRPRGRMRRASLRTEGRNRP